MDMIFFLIFGLVGGIASVDVSNFSPIRYDLSIKVPFHIEMEPRDYSGSVMIDFKCLHETNKVVLNVLDLEIRNVSLYIEHGRDISVMNIFVDVKKQLLIVELNESIKIDHVYKLHLEFNGLVKNDKMGLYWGSYETNNGVKRWYVASQVSRAYARKVFPCFDEPSLRAIFKLRVQHHISMNVISYTKESFRKKLADNLYETKFEETSFPISTYQFALVISDVVCESDDKSSVRVCVRPNAIDKIDYFYQAAVKSFKAFESMFRIKYPLSKLDHVALPDTLFAIEDNLGLSIYRETTAFHDSSNPRAFIEQEIIKNVALQTSIMWLESLTPTMRWHDLWLNAGLSHFLAYIGADRTNNEFNYRDQFTRYIFQTLEFESDGSMTSIGFENEKRVINEDFKIHLKIAAILRMLMFVVGEENFFRGLENYMRSAKYSNSTRFWEAIQREVGKSLDIAEVMNKWINQVGYPYLNISRVSQNQFHVKQHRFLMNQVEDTQVWPIPLSYSIERSGKSSEITRIEWMNNENLFINLNQSLQESDFILANLQVSGFYRVNYDLENWKNIINQLKTNLKVIPVLNRAALIEDAFNLAKAGLIELQLSLELTEYLENEREIIPWVTGIYHLRQLLDMINDKETQAKFEKKLQNLVKPVFNYLYDKNEETKLDILLRNQVMNFACYVNLDDCIDETRLFFEESTSGLLSDAPADLRQILFCTGIRHGNESDFNFAFNQYKNLKESSSNKQVLADLQAALTCTRNEILLKKYLNYVIENNKKEDMLRIFSYVISYHGADGLWKYVKENTNLIFQKLQNDDAKMRGFMNLVSHKLKDSHIKEFQEMFKGRNIENSISKIKLNTKISDKITNDLHKWFKM